MIMATFSLRACHTVLLITVLINALVDAQSSIGGVGPIGVPIASPLSTVDSSTASDTVSGTGSVDATMTTAPSATATGDETATTTSGAASPTSSGPLSIFVDLGTFLGDLSAGARPMNLSELTWQLGERKNISWTNSYQMTGKPVDLLLVQMLENSSQMNSLTLLANFTGNSTSWTVDVHNLSTMSVPPVDPNVFQFQLCESGQQLPIVTSQNITIPDAQANETGTTTPLPSQPTMTFASPPSPGSSKLSTGAIVGIAVGASVFVALLLLGLVHWICSKRRNKGPGGAAAMERAMPAGFDPVEGTPSYRQVQMSQPDNAGAVTTAAATTAAAAASTVGLAMTSNGTIATPGSASASARRDLWSPAPQIPPLHLSSDSQTNLSADPQPVPMSPSRPVSSLYSGGTLTDYGGEDAADARTVSLASSPSRHESDYLSPSPASPRPSSQLFSDARPWPLRESALHGNPP